MQILKCRNHSRTKYDKYRAGFPCRGDRFGTFCTFRDRLFKEASDEILVIVYDLLA